MAWTNVTEAMPPAGREVKMKFVDEEADWHGDPVVVLMDIGLDHYKTLLWWNECPDSAQTDQQALAVELFEFITGNNAKEFKGTVETIQRRYTIIKK
jgi:hypothetical protein